MKILDSVVDPPIKSGERNDEWECSAAYGFEPEQSDYFTVIPRLDRGIQKHADIA